MSELDRHIDILLRYMIKAGDTIPEYTKILILEEKNIRLEKENVLPGDPGYNEYGYVYRHIISRKALKVKDDFIEEFDKLLDRGYPWIDLNCAGLLGDALIFTVRVPGYTSDVPKEYVNVNYSGPRIIDEQLVWDLSGLYRII